MHAQIYFEARAGLAEGPVWDHRTNELHWVDIERGEIHRRAHASGEHVVVRLDESVGAAVPTASGDGWIVGLRSGVALVGFDGSVRHRVDIDHERQRHRMNDGACDARGRFWTGTLNEEDGEPCDSLYCVGTDWRVWEAQSGIGLSNGLAWSPDNAVMYRVDSKRGLIFASDFDASVGQRANERVLVDLSEEHAEPDGLTVDASGALWVAMWDGWRVDRYSHAGELIRSLELPVARPTSVAFGLDDLSTLFITTASKGASQEHAGAIFRVDVDTPGLPANWFG